MCNDDILTAKEVKDKLRCGLSTVYDLFEAGELRGFRLKTGGKRNGIRIYAESVSELMKRNANRAKPAPAPEPQASTPLPPPPRKPGRPGKVIPAAGLLSVRPRTH
jgi:excisionase family DNA binding protein